MLKKAYNFIINFILPHTCLSCKQYLDFYGICGDCFKNIKTITDPKCKYCGYPLPNRNRGKICGSCAKAPMSFTLRSSVVYDDNSKSVILSLKHADRLEVAPFMANAMLRSIRDINEDIDCVLAVPLHKSRLLKRRYNQSSELGKIIAKKLNINIIENAVIRKIKTSSQEGKSFIKRFKNIRGCFAINNVNNVNGKTILIIDDVFTSGATLSELSKTLLKAGAIKIIAVTYGRVVKPSR